MPKILTPDFDKTEMIDIRKYNSEALWKSQKGEEPFEYEDEEDPVLIEVGYIPAWKRTEFQVADAGIIGTGKAGELDEERLTRMYEVAREVVRWGVRGHNIENVPFASCPLVSRDKEYRLAAENIIDLYEHHDWLLGLKAAIMEYNSLDSEKKRQS